MADFTEVQRNLLGRLLRDAYTRRQQVKTLPDLTDEERETITDEQKTIADLIVLLDVY